MKIMSNKRDLLSKFGSLVVLRISEVQHHYRVDAFESVNLIGLWIAR